MPVPRTPPRIGRLAPALLIALLTLTAWAAPPLQAVPKVSPATVHLRFESVLEGLDMPVSATTDGTRDGKLYISELTGQVRVYQDGHLVQQPFLDLAGDVTAMSGEDGFYGIAFHPGYPRDRRFYAAYVEVGSDDLVVTEFRALPSLDRADPNYRKLVLRVPVDQPYHHGGGLAFGPNGYLFISTGDGQEANHWLHEPPFVAQSLSTLRGKVLRIDVDHGDPYAVPPSNPFVGKAGARGEIWALGFRNPWKLAIDPRTGNVFVGDVGNDRWEEVDQVVAGGNYGWPIREGPECQAFPDTPGLIDPHCADLPLKAPTAAYGHPSIDAQGGDAVTGGVIVRGSRSPKLDGRYLYGDFEDGRIWSLAQLSDGSRRVELVADTEYQITSFVETPDGQLYLTDMGGSLVRITAY